MKVFFAGDTFNRRNLGCRATTLALKSMILGCSEIYYSLDFKDLSKQVLPSAGKSYPLKLVYQAIEKFQTKILQQSFYPLKYSDFSYFLGRIERSSYVPEVFRKLEESDLVVINGEGSFLKTEKRFPGLMTLFLGYVSKTLFKKPCILINHTADLRHPDINEISRKVYPLFDDVAVREYYSLEQVKSIRDGKPSIFAADAVFTYKPLQGDQWSEISSRPHYYSYHPLVAENINTKEPYICIGGSAALHPYRRGNYNPIKPFAQLCLELNKIHPVVLIAACSIDEKYMRIVAKELKLPILGTSTPIYHALDLLANASIYVGGRWHSCIKAVTGGTPIVVFSSNTDFKSKGIIDLMHLDYLPFDSLKIEENIYNIVEMSKQFLHEGKNLRDKLLCRASELSLSAQNNLRFLFNNIN